MIEPTIRVESEAVTAALDRLQRALGGTLRVEAGTNVVYAAIHQFGGRAGRKSNRVTIPARPYLPEDELNQTDAGEIVAILNDHLQRAFGGERLSGRDAMTAAGRYLKASVQLRFREQKGPDGKKWAPSLRVRAHGGQTLSLTRRLRNSITYAVG